MRFRNANDLRLAQLDELARAIQRAVTELEAEGVISPGEDANRPPRFDGYCARACQAYVYLLKHPRTRELARDPDVRIQYIKHGPDYGDSHYWLLDSSDSVLDLNYAPGEKPTRKVRKLYQGEVKGRGIPPLASDKRYPQNGDARKVMDRVWQNVG